MKEVGCTNPSVIRQTFAYETITVKTFELRKDAKRPQSNSNFMNKIGGRSNTEFSNLDS